MASDAHAHPAVLRLWFAGADGANREARDAPLAGEAAGPAMERERRAFRAAVAASAWNREEFEFHDSLSRRAREDGAPPLYPCFGVHPQLCGAAGNDEEFTTEDAEKEERGGRECSRLPQNRRKGASSRAGFFPPAAAASLETLASLAGEGRLRGVGECGFDLYGEFRESEALQDRVFPPHLEIAREKALPLTLHIRRAMHKVFALTGELKKVPAVVFHSYSGTLEEARALLKRGVNAYFSFGTTVALNHRQAMRAAAALPPDRLLTETDAPFQPLRGAAFSRWADLPLIVRTLADLRGEDAAALEAAIDRNFFAVFVG